MPTTPRSNYELFNYNNINIRYWSWNYRGCWPFFHVYSQHTQCTGPKSLSWGACAHARTHTHVGYVPYPQGISSYNCGLDKP